jgi:uncharacterized protein YprB with RNaseH-like and TPR domain
VYRTRVVSLGRKLFRLEAALATAQPADPVPVPLLPCAAVPLLSERSTRLEELRARMQVVLERGAPRPARPRTFVEAPELPFVSHETPLGVIHVRRVRFPASHRMGRASVLAAREASAELLGLLSLNPSLLICDPARALYLDTETTGLHGGTGTIAFLVGLAFWEKDDSDRGGPVLVVEQLLVRRPGEEAPMLERVAARLRDASMVVTFNGKAFDLPLLRTRFTMARMPLPEEPPHLDLVHVARRLHRDPAGPCKLTSIEQRVLGFERYGDVASADVSARYLHFLRTGDVEGLLDVVKHNAFDVVAMVALVGLYGEPLGTTSLSPGDLVGVAQTLLRAGEKERAFEIVHRAVGNGAGDLGLLARAQIAKKSGDRARALVDFETLSSKVDDPRVRLELAKLYEHFVKEPTRALAVARRGTGERPDRAERRARRLGLKIERENKVVQGALFAKERPR